MRPTLLLAMVAALATFSGRAAADPSPTDLAVAQTLFDEGRALLDAGRYDEACEKLTLSQRLDPGAGTLLNLALCHEKQGGLATAWTEYTEALALARRDRREDRITFAEEHIADLARRLPRMRIVVRDAASVVVHLDDVVVDRVALGLAIPVNPGRHVVRATSTGKVPWMGELVVRAGESTDVQVPELASSPLTVESSPASGRRTIGWTVAGVGGAAIVAGAVAGVVALDRNSQSSSLCPSEPCTNPDGVQASKDAVTAAWIANGAIAGGIVAVVVGTYLVLTSPSSRAPTTKTVTALRPGFGGLAWTF